MTDPTPWASLTCPVFSTLAADPPSAGAPVAGRPEAQSGTATVTGAPGSETQKLGTGSQQAPPPGLGFEFFFIILGFFALMIFLQFRAGKKEKQRRAELLTSLKRNDRVQTLGGMIGTIVELKDDEVVLRVDESTNTKIAFSKAAVQSVLKSAREDSLSRRDREKEEVAAGV
ncbi:MAG: preprotein translocase subunit YajC [Phycisphaerales bacterium]|nr:preprotein translocase subunit YajC [Phycisphaerales bacterium]